MEKLPLSGYWYLEAPELWKMGYRRCADRRPIVVNDYPGGRATRANKLRTEVACHGPLRSARGCTTLPRYSSDDACCWLASQSGHAGQGAMCIAGDCLSTKVNSSLSVSGSNNASLYPRSFRPTGCIGPRNGICAKSLSCLLVAGPFPSDLFLSAKHLLFAAIRLMALIKIADLIKIGDLIALVPRRARMVVTSLSRG